MHYIFIAHPQSSLEDYTYKIHVDVDSTLSFTESETIVNIFKCQMLTEYDPFNKVAANFIEIGPYRTMETPWGSNAKSILLKCGVTSVNRIEKTRLISASLFDPLNLDHIDPMTEEIYVTTFRNNLTPQSQSPQSTPLPNQEDQEDQEEEDSVDLENWEHFDSQDKKFYGQVFKKLNRNPRMIELMDLTNSNSEHSRHWFFKGKLFDFQKQKFLKYTLFSLIKNTLSTLHNPRISNRSVVAFSDNSSAIHGFTIQTIVPQSMGRYQSKHVKYHITFTAETHNFPTSVAPFQGATTGTGGRIRDNQTIGRGGLVVAGTAGYCVGEIEPHLSEYHAKNLRTLLKASDGASDYGNKFGEPLVLGFCRAFGHTFSLGGGGGGDQRRIEWVKPIMFSAGIGQMDAKHVVKREPREHMSIIKIGGPAYKIGVGGGASSSRNQDTKNHNADMNAVQRGDAQMENKLNRVIRTCIEMGDMNPILSIHDQGAGGTGNVTKEIVYGSGQYKTGATILLDAIPAGDSTMTDTELWISEYQESNTLLVLPQKIPVLQRICKRENVPFAKIGTIDNSGYIRVQSKRSDKTVFELPLEDILGNTMPQKTFQLHPLPTLQLPLRAPPQPTNYRENIIRKVLSLISVGSKRFLTNKVDRSVTGLVAQQQCVGSLHTPISDYAVIAQSHFSLSGAATSIGEKPLQGITNPSAMASMAIGEMLTNLIFAKITDLHDVRISGNWMWPLHILGEKTALYQACQQLCKICKTIGIALDGGKDSLSMVYKDSKKRKTIVCPRQLVLSAYAPMQDIRKKITPDFKQPGNLIVFVDLAQGNTRMGLSAYQHANREFSDNVPHMTNPTVVKKLFKHINSNLDLAEAGHDRSDGGLFTTICEMAFAGNLGASLKRHDLSKTWEEYWFNEELGIVLEISPSKFIQFMDKCVGEHSPDLRKSFHVLGVVTPHHPNPQYSVKGIGGMLIFDKESYRMTELRDMWESKSFQLEKLQCNVDCVKQEQLSLRKHQTIHYSTQFNLLPSVQSQREMKIAIIREEGSNGDREMASVFYMAGFDVYDICMNDLIIDKSIIDLSQFRGIAFVGGFSYSDVGGAATGWYHVIQSHPRVRKMFSDFRQRKNTFSLGVCNGCQLLLQLGWVGNNEWTLKQNKSRRFESRFPTVQINQTNSILLKDMQDSKLGVWVAHGQGNFQYKYPSPSADITPTKSKTCPNVALQYLNNDMQPTEDYPFNPNGSHYAAAALSSDDGRHLAMMPHPERCFLSWQMPYSVGFDNRNSRFSPWFRMFQNAYVWCAKK